MPTNVVEWTLFIFLALVSVFAFWASTEPIEPDEYARKR